MNFDEDFVTYFDDFGVAATLNRVAVRGILDETPQIAFGSIGGNDPRFVLRAAELSIDPRGQALLIDARSFTVRDWAADGTGLATLQLEAA